MHQIAQNMERIGELARAGLDPKAIAEQLGLGTEAVERCLVSPGVRAALRLNEGVGARGSGLSDA